MDLKDWFAILWNVSELQTARRETFSSFRYYLLSLHSNIPPRHPIFQNYRDLNKDLLEKIINEQPLDLPTGSIITFVFPERWLSISEQTSFIVALNRHPEVLDINQVRIVTGSNFFSMKNEYYDHLAILYDITTAYRWVKNFDK